MRQIPSAAWELNWRSSPPSLVPGLCSEQCKGRRNKLHLRNMRKLYESAPTDTLTQQLIITVSCETGALRVNRSSLPAWKLNLRRIPLPGNLFLHLFGVERGYIRGSKSPELNAFRTTFSNRSAHSYGSTLWFPQEYVWRLCTIFPLPRISTPSLRNDAKRQALDDVVMPDSFLGFINA